MTRPNVAMPPDEPEQPTSMTSPTTPDIASAEPPKSTLEDVDYTRKATQHKGVEEPRSGWLPTPTRPAFVLRRASHRWLRGPCSARKAGRHARFRPSASARVSVAGAPAPDVLRARFPNRYRRPQPQTKAGVSRSPDQTTRTRPLWERGNRRRVRLLIAHCASGRLGSLAAGVRRVTQPTASVRSADGTS